MKAKYLIPLLITLICYLVGAFLCVDFNIKEWHYFARAAIVVCWLVSILIWVGFNLDKK